VRAILLDFDGVLNFDSWDSRPCPAPRGSVEWLTRQLDPSRVELLNELVTRVTGAEPMPCIVLSTSWRTHPPLYQLREILESVGLRAPVIGATPYVKMGALHAPRDREIASWINAVRPDAFVVLDDWEMTLPEIKRWSVRCDPACGLIEADVEQAVEMFAKQARRASNG
jgi:hypothetical protein